MPRFRDTFIAKVTNATHGRGTKARPHYVFHQPASTETRQIRLAAEKASVYHSTGLHTRAFSPLAQCKNSAISERNKPEL